MNADAAQLALAKRKATSIAQAALWGLEVVELPDGAFLVGKSGLSPKSVPDLPALREFLRELGVRVEA